MEVELEGGTVAVHSHVLMAASDVFARMLQSDMQEAHSGRIVLKDKKLEDFKLVLEHLDVRGGALPPPIKRDKLELMLEYADEYQISGLKDRCQSFLQRLSKTEPEYVLRLADQYELNEAKAITARCLVSKSDSALLDYEHDKTIRNTVYRELLQSVDDRTRHQKQLLKPDYTADDAHAHATRHWAVILKTLADLKSEPAPAPVPFGALFQSEGNDSREKLYKLVHLFLSDFEQRFAEPSDADESSGET